MPNLSLVHNGNMNITSAEITSAGTLNVVYGKNETGGVSDFELRPLDDEFLCGNTYTIIAIPQITGTVQSENFTVSGYDKAGVKRSDTSVLKQGYDSQLNRIIYKCEAGSMVQWADVTQPVDASGYGYDNCYAFDVTINQEADVDVMLSWVNKNNIANTGYTHTTLHIEVTQEETVATSVTLNVSSEIISSGRATANYSPAWATVSLVFSSSDTSKATIDPQTGEITVLENGIVVFCVTDLISNLQDCKTVEVFKQAPERRLAITFDVTSTTTVTKILAPYGISGITMIEEDGIQIPVATGYTFDTLGLHTLYYTLADQTTVPAYAFTTLPRICRIVIPNNVTTLGQGCFEEYIRIPGTISSSPDPIERELVLGTGLTPNSFYFTGCPFTAFGDAGVYSSISLDRQNPEIGELFVSGNCLMLKSSESSWELCFGCNNSVIPEGTWKLRQECLSGLRKTSINIPEGVMYIGDGALSTTLLTGVTLPASVVGVDYTMFQGSKDLYVITCFSSPAPVISGMHHWGIKRENSDGIFYYPCEADYSDWLDDYNEQNQGLVSLGWTPVCFNNGSTGGTFTISFTQTRAGTVQVFNTSDVSGGWWEWYGYNAQNPFRQSVTGYTTSGRMVIITPDSGQCYIESADIVSGNTVTITFPGVKRIPSYLLKVDANNYNPGRRSCVTLKSYELGYGIEYVGDWAFAQQLYNNHTVTIPETCGAGTNSFASPNLTAYIYGGPYYPGTTNKRFNCITFEKYTAYPDRDDYPKVYVASNQIQYFQSAYSNCMVDANSWVARLQGLDITSLSIYAKESGSAETATTITNSGSVYVSYQPSNAMVDITYSASNATIISLNATSGAFTVLRPGTVTVTATDSISSLSASVTLNCLVTDPETGDTKVIVYYNVTSTTQPTKILSTGYTIEWSGDVIDTTQCVDQIRLADNTVVPIGTGYTFSATGITPLSFTFVNNIEGVEYSGQYYGCFADCPAIVSVVVQSGIEGIGRDGFKNCVNLDSVFIQTGVKIPNYVFSGCTSLSYVSLASASTSTVIDTGAFGGCSSLTNLIVPSGYVAIYDDVFSGCTSLTAVTLPNDLTELWEAFKECGIVELEIPSGVTTIRSIIDCPNLQKVVIKATNYYFYGNTTFYNCTGLTELWSYATTAPSLAHTNITGTFDNIGYNGILYYPSGSNYSSWLSGGEHRLGYYGWTGSGTL